jgi:hypothetical protein
MGTHTKQTSLDRQQSTRSITEPSTGSRLHYCRLAASFKALAVAAVEVAVVSQVPMEQMEHGPAASCNF